MKQTISFWEENHPRYQEYSNLWDEHVPARGASKTVEGELVRAVGRLFHEYCNNGNCNAAHKQTYYEYETCGRCSGTGEIDYGDDEQGNPMIEECSDCLGCGEIQEEYDDDMFLDSYYEGFLKFIENHVGCWREVEAVEKLVTNKTLNYNYTYSQEEMDVYNNLVVRVLDHIKGVQEFTPNPNYKPENLEV